MMTYDKFMSTVPTETQDYVKEVLPYLKENILNNSDQNIGNTSIRNSYLKKVIIFCYTLTKIKQYSPLLGQYNIKFPKIDSTRLYEYDGSMEKVINQLSSLFLIYENESDYYSLLPLDFLVNLKKELEELGDDYIELFINEDFKKLAPNCDIVEFLNKIQEQAIISKEEYKNKLEMEILGELPISTIDYCKTAVKIRAKLNEIFSTSNKDSSIKSNIDYAPLSLLLAIYFYESKETKKIKEILEKYNIDLTTITNKLLIESPNDNFESSFDVNILKKEYIKYLPKKNKKKKKEIKISDIFINALDREISKSYIVERVLTNDSTEYKLIIDDIKNEFIDIRKELNDFYQNLPKETREFIEFSNKIYQVIKKKMQENTHNKELLLDDNDAIVLSLYMANCYYEGNINQYFTEYGDVTLEKVLNLINLKITKEEIESTPINKQQMIAIYKEIIYKDSQVDSKNININQICLNISDGQFTKSLILKNIFNSLANSSIGDCFSSEIKEYLKTKEEKRQNELSQKIFYDMKLETITFLKETLKYHQLLLKEEKVWHQQNLQIISLLLATLNSDDELKNFLISHSNLESSYNSFDQFKIKKYFKLDNNYNKPPTIETNIEILINDYHDFIFNGLNKNIAREDITVYDIVKNALSKELNNSVMLDEFLLEYGINYKENGSFDKAYKEYIEKKENESAKQSVSFLLQNINKEHQNYKILINAIKIHKRINNKLANQESPSSLEDKDIEKISFIISLFVTQDETDSQLRYFCEKNKLTLSNILSYCNIDNLDMYNLDEEINYKLMLKNYKKYIQEKIIIPREYEDEIQTRIILLDAPIIKVAFSNQHNDSTILKNIVEYFNGNYNILEEEITSGKEHRLTLTERIELLTSENMSNIVPEDINSILTFGNCLLPHSKHIHDEIPQLLTSETSEQSVKTINELIDRVHPKEVIRKKSLFERIFSVDKNDSQQKLTLNTKAIEELKKEISDNIGLLSKELLTFDKIRKYMEVYQRKNNEYLTIAKETLEKIKAENSNQENEEDFANILSSNTNLEMIKAKVNQFTVTNQLMMQELVKINENIKNHFLIINTLEMASNTLLPLILTELAINQGKETENSAIELSHSIMDLFQSLLVRNTETAKETMEKISSLGINGEIIEIIKEDVLTYIKNLEEVNAPNNNTNNAPKVKKLINDNIPPHKQDN